MLEKPFIRCETVCLCLVSCQNWACKYFVRHLVSGCSVSELYCTAVCRHPLPQRG